MTSPDAALAQRNRYVEENLDLVKGIAASIKREMKLPASFDLDDLIQIGNLGLINAATRYNPSLNVPFRCYAQLRIRGSIIDQVRRRHFAENTRSELTVAMIKRHSAVASNVTAIDQAIDDAKQTAQLRSAARRLNQRHQRVIQLYYYEERTLAQTGADLGVGESRTSQIVKEAVVKLREQLGRAA